MATNAVDELIGAIREALATWPRGREDAYARRVLVAALSIFSTSEGARGEGAPRTGHDVRSLRLGLVCILSAIDSGRDLPGVRALVVQTLGPWGTELAQAAGEVSGGVRPAGEVLEDIRRNPERHHHDFAGLVRCSTVGGSLHLHLFDAHARYAPVRTRDGRPSCDVVAGRCSCGETH